MEIAVAILALLLKQVPELVKMIEAWNSDEEDYPHPMYGDVSKALDGALAELDAKLKEKSGPQE